MLKFSPKNSETIFPKEIQESDGIFENMSFVKMESSKLINYSTNMCGIGQGKASQMEN
jgi:hypothetical protein